MVIVQKTNPALEKILEKKYQSKRDAANALNVTVATINKWLLNNNGYKPGNDLLKVRVRVVGNPKARKVATPKPRQRKKRRIEVKPDYFKPVFGFWCIVACIVVAIAL